MPSEPNILVKTNVIYQLTVETEEKCEVGALNKAPTKAPLEHRVRDRVYTKPSKIGITERTCFSELKIHVG